MLTAFRLRVEVDFPFVPNVVCVLEAPDGLTDAMQAGIEEDFRARLAAAALRGEAPRYGRVHPGPPCPNCPPGGVRWAKRVDKKREERRERNEKRKAAGQVVLNP